MGYCADTADLHFLIPAADIPAALDAVNSLLAARRSVFFGPGPSSQSPCPPDPYPSLSEAIETETNFEGCEEGEDGFFLGWHADKWYED